VVSDGSSSDAGNARELAGVEDAAVKVDHQTEPLAGPGSPSEEDLSLTAAGVMA
jgi:hypothetical protein